MTMKKEHIVDLYQKAQQTILPVMEQFYSVQGEGFHSGKAACFIRLAGCNVGCVWCDVKESWDADLHPDCSVDELVTFAQSVPSDLAIITGGEPLMYNLDYLTQQLQAANIKTHIETSGAYPLTGQWDWVCLSPKKFKAPLLEVCEAANELKIIVFNKSDFAWAEKYAALVGPDCRLFLQVEWSKSEKMMPLVVEYVTQHPQWRISLQTHKYMDIR